MNLRILLRESTGIEAWATAEFEDMGAGSRTAGRKEGVCDLLSMVSEEVFAA
jgi:hypothetical protein